MKGDLEMKKINQKKGLSATVSMFMTLAVCQSVTTQASDIDIYSSSTGGLTRIMFVLDTSYSMISTFGEMACDAPSGATVTGRNNTAHTESVAASTVGGIAIPAYTRYKCTIRETTIPPKIYSYTRQVISQTTAAQTDTKTLRCGANNSSTVATPEACAGFNNSNSHPSTTYKCPYVVTSGNTTTTYYYARSSCLSSATKPTGVIFNYRRIEEIIPAITVSANTCTPGGNISCGYDYKSCPTGATATTACTTTIASVPSGAPTNFDNTCGTGCNAYFTQAAATDRVVYDRITKLKEGMLDVLIGRNSTTRLADDIIVGLTKFESKIGDVSVVARRLDSDASATSGCSGRTQRSCLVAKIVGMTADDYTPTGIAYAQGAKSLLDTIDTDTSTCNGNGVYVLTDGGPSASSDISNTNTTNAMSTAISGFTCPADWNVDITNTNPTFQFKSWTPPASGTSYDNQHVWRCIAKFSDTLLKGAANRAKIKTATVGFGSFYEGLDAYTNDEKTKSAGTPLSSSNVDIQNILNRFNSITNAWAGTQGGSSRADIANTALWGVYGRGGWYAASQPEQVAKSILKFVDQVKPEFDPITTGSPTLPQDALNPLRIQPYGYYASFVPKPQESTQLWAGNLNKYHIHLGALYDSGKSKPLIKTDGSLDSTASGIWTNGVKGQLPLGLNEQVANRTIYTNRQIIGTAAPFVASEANSLKKVNMTTLFGTDATAVLVNDPDKNYWLNLLGYNVGATETGITLENLAAKPELRQVGAVMHSTPILLTQRGQIKYSSGTIDTTDRDDFLLFGSTQGLLHVVDADTGVEKFAFAPNEMMQRQKAAFLSETSSTGGPSSLFYGIDAPWTAYTQYVSKADGTLTVNSSDRTSDGTSNADLALKGLQWVYGGLRMGGRSYYALDLSDLDSPSLKFHINPDAAVTTDANGTTIPDTNNALSYMGQSWSKPTLAYVKFGGIKKLVMFVGGGYDAGYENAAYNQSTTTGGGAGVYMFDANNGNLLWWTSANATAAKGAEAFTDASASTTDASASAINMKYSVVSQINAIDRDNDGLVDNLYFGDLGGQAFRVDLNNAATGADASVKKANFATRVVRLFNENASGGASPRFYEMPSVSIHEDNGYIAAVAFSSGNRSSPLVGTAVTGGNQAGSTTSATDGVFVVFDKDVAKTNLYATSPAPTLTTKNVSLASLNTNIGTGIAVATNNGWKYTYNNTAGVYKGMNELYALDGMLYVNVFHRDGTGIGGSCGAGVKGDSYVYQFCLPTGKCSFATTTRDTPNRVKLGAGILGAGLGQGFNNANNTGLIVNRPTTDCTTAANKNKPECQEFATTAKLRQLRWYETR